MLSSLAPLSGRPRRDNASGCGRAYAPRLAPFFAVAGLFLAQLETDRAGADPLFDGGRVSGPDLVRRIEVARSSALGSRENPVRVHMPAGQQAYLSRLRCGTGAPAEFARVGSFGAGPFGSIIDGYRIRCGGEERAGLMFLDMYHPEHREGSAPPGFTIVPPRPAGSRT